VERLRTWATIAASMLLLTCMGACVKRYAVEEPIYPNWTTPQVMRFAAQPQIIHRGDKALITWNVRNVSRVSLEEALEPDGGVPEQFLRLLGDFPANGSLTVSPKTTATYVLSCGSESASGLGCVSASVNVVVK
jgi:hypothetical protein